MSENFKNKKRFQKGPVILTTLMIMVLCSSQMVFASGDIDPLWLELLTKIEKWVNRIGALVILVGGVNFGIGWMSDEPSRKVAGVTMIAAGGIIMTMVALATSLV